MDSLPQNQSPHSFAAYCYDDSILNASSSGGVFYYLAKETIQKGGTVFGAVFSEDWQVIHAFCSNLKDLQKFMTSKYVQSDISECYTLIKKLLVNNKPVLFCGTPCCDASNIL